MKFLTTIIATLLLSAAAQAFSGDFEAARFANGGESFRQTCQVIRESSRSIEANCRDTRGRMVYNNFDRRGCSGDIANVDGYLTCASSLPAGSYQLTCRACSVDYPTLYCSCQDTRGRYRQTSVYLPSCRGEIANNDGMLVCP